MNKSEALNRLTSLENEAKELRKIIETPDSPSKPTAKEWLLNFLSQPFTVKLSKGYITYYLDDQWIFQQDLKNSIVWCYYYKVWDIFYKEYSLDYAQVQQLMKDLLLEPLNCKGYTPLQEHLLLRLQLLEPLNCKGYTPHYLLWPR